MTGPLQDEARGTLPGIGTVYTHIAHALARGYTDLYYVNVDTDEFIEFHTDDEHGVLAEVRRGTDFYEGCERDVKLFVHRDDQEASVSGGIVIACGMAKYGNDTCVATVFERADQKMYENKARLKAGKA